MNGCTCASDSDELYDDDINDCGLFKSLFLVFCLILGVVNN